MSDDDLLSRRYSANELAAMAGVSPRRLRYYVREKLIDPPLGLGRGRHYDCEHLSQLRRVLSLRRAGLGHAAIRADGEMLRHLLTSQEYDVNTVKLTTVGMNERPPETERVTRLRMAPGIELLVDQDHDLPQPDRLLALAQAIRSAFGILGVQAPSTGGEGANLR